MKLDQILFLLTPEGKIYHPAEDCLSFEVEPGSVLKVTLKELEVIFTEDLLCQDCGTMLNFVSTSDSAKKYNFETVDYLFSQAESAKKLKLKKQSFKAIAKTLPERDNARRVIGDISKGYSMPAAPKLQKALQKRIDVFDRAVEEFRESPEGLAAIIKYSSHDIFKEENIFFELPTGFEGGKNSPKLLGETKELHDYLQKRVKRLTKAPIYSIYRHWGSAFNPLGIHNLERVRTDSASACLNRLISDRWLNTSDRAVSMPYMVALYLENTVRRYGRHKVSEHAFEVLHLDQEPSGKLLECLNVFLSDGNEGLSLIEAYNAAVAID